VINLRRISRLVSASMAAIFYSCLATAQVLSSPNLVPTTTHAPDEFGTQDYTVTTISAASFTPAGVGGTSPGFYTFSLTRGFLGSGPGGCSGAGELGEFFTTVNVPSGAIIDFIGIDTCSDLDGSWGVELFLRDRYGNQSPIESFSSSAHCFDTDYNLAPMGYQLARNVHNELVLNVEEAGNANSCPLFAWAEIWWKRMVSPPPGSPTFNDVPTSDPGFQYIEALAASSITAGCGGGNYCPNAGLTRRQMAVFLSKALGLHWPY
jgi:S-layer homology domain